MVFKTLAASPVVCEGCGSLGELEMAKWGERAGREANWAAIARSARSTLDNAPRGTRETQLHVLAEAVGLNPQTIRRAVAALRFLDEADLGGLDLRTAPLAGVEAIRRLYAYDQGRARESAQQLIAGELVSNITKAEQLARSAAQKPSKYMRLLGLKYMQFVARLIPVKEELRAEIVRIGAAKSNIRSKRKSKYEPIVDIQLFDSNNDIVAVAEVIGPYYDEIKNSKQLVFNKLIYSLGLSRVYGNVFVVFHNRDLCVEAMRWFNENNCGDILKLVYIPYHEIDIDKYNLSTR